MTTNEIRTVNVVIIKDEQVLLVRHTESADHLNNTYGLPGGRCNDRETETQTAQRELLEETGLAILPEGLVPIDKVFHARIERKSGRIESFLMKVFSGNGFSGSLRRSQETVPEWIKLSDIHSYNLLPNTEEAINEVLGF